MDRGGRPWSVSLGLWYFGHFESPIHVVTFDSWQLATLKQGHTENRGDDVEAALSVAVARVAVLHLRAAVRVPAAAALAVLVVGRHSDQLIGRKGERFGTCILTDVAFDGDSL